MLLRNCSGGNWLFSLVAILLASGPFHIVAQQVVQEECHGIASASLTLCEPQMSGLDGWLKLRNWISTPCLVQMTWIIGWNPTVGHIDACMQIYKPSQCQKGPGGPVPNRQLKDSEEKGDAQQHGMWGKRHVCMHVYVCVYICIETCVYTWA